MIFYIAAAILFLLCLWRFVRRVLQEAYRQRVLTWPRAVATLGEGEDNLPAASVDKYQETTFFRAELEREYVFYARGQRYTGRRIAPGLQRLNASEASLLLKKLGEQRRYEVYFNPDQPTENYLTVGRPLLTYGHQLLYLLFGIVWPLLLIGVIVLAQEVTGRAVILGMVGLGLSIAGLAAYYAIQPLFNLGTVLLPASSGIVEGDGLLPGRTRERVVETVDINRGTAR